MLNELHNSFSLPESYYANFDKVALNKIRPVFQPVQRKTTAYPFGLQEMMYEKFRIM